METLQADDPRQVGPHRLIRRLGAGGMGQVFLGRSPSGRLVAVKTVHPWLAAEPEFRRRFRQEVETARKVRGAWTAQVLDADTDSRLPWVVTGYIPGLTLPAALTGAGGTLPEHTTSGLGHGLVKALEAVHACGLVHRDVKPSNVLLTPDGPRLIDFGIARAVTATTMTRTGMALGTPGFMAPEQVRGERVTASADVFSLGAVLAFALTGRGPFDTGEDVGAHALMYRIVSQPPELDSVDGPLREIIDDCLAKDAEARPSLDTLAARFTDLADGSKSTWLPEPLLAKIGRHTAELISLENPPAPPQTPPPSPRMAPSAPLTPQPVPQKASPPRTAPPIPHHTPPHAPPPPNLPSTVPPHGPAPAGTPPGWSPQYPPPVRRGPSLPEALKPYAPLLVGGAAFGGIALVIAFVFAVIGQDGPVPDRLLGTWEGPIMGNRTHHLVIRQGDIGDRMATARNIRPRSQLPSRTPRSGAARGSRRVPRCATRRPARRGLP